MHIGIPIYRQQAAIREIEQAGGQVDTEEGGPEFLRDRIGDDLMQSFDKVVGVDLDGSENPHAAFPRLKGLVHLRSLSLVDTPVGDSELVNLNGLRELTSLLLDDTSVSDAGLIHLHRLLNLQELSLTDTQVGDAGLVHLKGLTSLVYLDLAGTQITDAGLIHLNGLPLQFLDLGGTRVTDTGLTRLKGLTSLQNLDLRRTGVTDAGLVHLQVLKGLKVILLYETDVTAGGVAELRRTFPTATIHREQLPGPGFGAGR